MLKLKIDLIKNKEGYRGSFIYIEKYKTHFLIAITYLYSYETIKFSKQYLASS